MNKTKLPLIFSVVGALGVFATGALASFATIKAVKLLEGEDKQLKDISFDKETIQKSWKSYILPASVATVSVVSIFVANGVNRNMLVTLASGLAAMSESYRYYRNRVMEKAPETDTEIVEEMSKGDFITPDGHNFGEVVTFYDPISDRLFERTWVELGDAFYHLNRNFALRGYAYTNELYHFLGLDYTDEGDIYGWYGDWFWEDGLVPWIDYGTHLETHDGKEVYNLVFTWPEQNLHGTDYEFPTIHEPSYFVAPF